MELGREFGSVEDSTASVAFTNDGCRLLVVCPLLKRWS